MVDKVIGLICVNLSKCGTLSDKNSSEKNLCRKRFSTDKIFVKMSKFRQFCPTKKFSNELLSKTLVRCNLCFFANKDVTKTFLQEAHVEILA